MKLYKTTDGIVIEEDGKFYKADQDWETFVNDDNVLEHASSLIKSIAPADASILGNVQATIGDHQELWACGVTYYRSMVGRQEESKASGGADFYGKVYEAERPECFFKSTPHRIVGHNAFVRIRKDSTWDVPEPEL